MQEGGIRMTKHFKRSNCFAIEVESDFTKA